MTNYLLCIFGLLFSCYVMAHWNQNIEDVRDLKPGMCLEADVSYHRGELRNMGNVTKVCTSINGRDLWLTVDQKDLEEMSR